MAEEMYVGERHENICSLDILSPLNYGSAVGVGVSREEAGLDPGSRPNPGKMAGS